MLMVHFSIILMNIEIVFVELFIGSTNFISETEVHFLLKCPFLLIKVIIVGTIGTSVYCHSGHFDTIFMYIAQIIREILGNN